jgi:hypothetical protein
MLLLLEEGTYSDKLSKVEQDKKKGNAGIQQAEHVHFEMSRGENGNGIYKNHRHSGNYILLLEKL